MYNYNFVKVPVTQSKIHQNRITDSQISNPRRGLSPVMTRQFVTRLQDFDSNYRRRYQNLWWVCGVKSVLFEKPATGYSSLPKLRLRAPHVEPALYAKICNVLSKRSEH